MKKKLSSKKWIQEYNEFVGAHGLKPSQKIDDSIFASVHKDLNPSVWWVFAKLSGIHTITGLLTLLFCPQFGFGFSDGIGLMSIFMRFGEKACMLGCGAVFVGASTLTAGLALRIQEVCLIRKTGLLQIFALALLSIGVFICSGLEIVSNLGIFWILGSLLGGLGSIELGYAVRRFMKL